ncbi:MAG: hypothetical protein ACK5E6_10585 [Cyanobacteriota bacterium]
MRLRHLRTFAAMLSLDQLRQLFSEEELPLLRRGTRLSVLPVSGPVAGRLLELLDRD